MRRSSSGEVRERRDRPRVTAAFPSTTVMPPDDEEEKSVMFALHVPQDALPVAEILAGRVGIIFGVGMPFT